MNVQSEVWTPTTAIYEFMGIIESVVMLTVDYVMGGYYFFLIANSLAGVTVNQVSITGMMHVDTFKLMRQQMPNILDCP